MLNDRIESLSGIGETRAKLFAKLGIYTIMDLLHYYPRDYQDRTVVKKVAELTDGETVCVKAIPVTKISNIRGQRRINMQKLQVSDDTGHLTIVWFNQPFLNKIFDLSREYVFYGTVHFKSGRAEMSSPTFESVQNDRFTRKIIPIYSLTQKITQKMLQSTIQNCIGQADNIEETLPDWLLEKYNLCSISYAIKNIHLPNDYNTFQAAHKRLAFEELLTLHLSIRNVKAQKQKEKGQPLFNIEGLDCMINALPYTLTNAQNRVVQEIISDLRKDIPMSRLVQGDVGSGKTIIAAIAMFIARQNGVQAALMVPTEILAEQHFQTLHTIFDDIILLTGSIPAKQKKEIYEKIKTGKVSMVIGTHALLEKEVAFLNLALVITDEQHRFGVMQRKKLEDKGRSPHLLVMSATPIPRTLALILYGDLDISIIDEMPPGRKLIETYAVDESYRFRINNFLEKELNKGRQIYVVCPLVDESETSELTAATEYAGKLQKQVFPNYKIGLIHGKMPGKKKEEIMHQFSVGQLQVLVSTTVIEVGVNVPNASVMVIENAERFGLSQLHQLRGRVGRGIHQSYCILFVQGGNEITRERMAIMAKTNDGFLISEKDLLLRGPGDFFGVKQHGLPEMKIANLYQDMNLLKLSSLAADEIIKKEEPVDKLKISNLLQTL